MPASRPPICCSAASCRSSTRDDGREPDPAELRARALEAENAALAVRGRHQLERRRRERLGVDHRARDLGRVFGRLSHERPRLLGVGRSPAKARSMQRDHAWHSARHLEDLEAAADIGRRAGERAVARLNPDAAEAGQISGAVRPARLGDPARPFRGCDQRLVDRAQDELPPGQARRSRCSRQGSRSSTIRCACAACARARSTAKACALSRQELVSDGVLNQLDRRQRVGAAARDRADRSCRARRRRRARARRRATSTSSPASRSREELLGSVPEAVLIIELIGQGVNGVTGDYSRGAVGFMVRGGEIAEPVAEITIAGKPHRHVRNAGTARATSSSAAASMRRRSSFRK